MREDIEKLLNIPRQRELKPFFDYLTEMKKISVFGMNRAHKNHTVASIKEPVFYVVTDTLECVKTVESLEAYGKRVVRFPEKEDTLFFKRSSSEGVYGRLFALEKILTGDFDVVVATPESVMTYTPKKESFLESVIRIEVDQDYDLELFVQKLLSSGYSRAEYADQKGVFAVRGDIVDVFIPSYEKPFRIEFFGETVEKIRLIDERDGVRSLTIIPVTDLLLTDGEKRKVVERLGKIKSKGLKSESESRLREIISDVVFVLDSGASDTRLNWAIPYASDFLGSVYDYLPQNTICVYDECRLLMDRTERLFKEHANRVVSLCEKGEVTPDHAGSVRSKNGLYYTGDRAVAFQQITTSNPLFEPTAVFSFKSTPISRYHLDRESLVGDTKAWKMNGYTVVLCCRDEDGAKTVADELIEHGIDAVCSKNVELDTTTCVPWDVKNGLIFHESGIVVIGTEELLRKKREKEQTQKKND